MANAEADELKNTAVTLNSLIYDLRASLKGLGDDMQNAIGKLGGPSVGGGIEAFKKQVEALDTALSITKKADVSSVFGKSTKAFSVYVTTQAFQEE